ncbi:hypothetical protein HPP92_016175 [Vanilla planifolia]|uniref:Uncharacterized protein n=1 Tax=Vanilla planifolia TaxID=51239 RepID=A0A835QAF7_VANPL|nr:hypothetical protein HPP92_016175 [Vanilla planifolia]
MGNNNHLGGLLHRIYNHYNKAQPESGLHKAVKRPQPANQRPVDDQNDSGQIVAATDTPPRQEKVMLDGSKGRYHHPPGSDQMTKVNNDRAARTKAATGERVGRATDGKGGERDKEKERERASVRERERGREREREGRKKSAKILKAVRESRCKQF